MPSPLLNSLTSLSQLGQVIHDKSEKGKAFQTLAVDRIYSKAQPRTVFENLEELAESLKELGQQQPIVVSPDNKGYYVIEQGERRWRAAKLAGLAREHESGTVFLAKWNDRRSSWNGLWPTNSRKTERLSRQSGTLLSQTGTLP